VSGLLDRLRAALRREKADVAEAWDDAKGRLDDALDRREADLAASPEERLRIEQERAAAADAEYDALRKKIEGS
jgi:hypothetical protein